MALGIEGTLANVISSMSISMSHKAENLPQAWFQITKALRSLQFGWVEITIHHRRIVQIERREKPQTTRESARPQGHDYAGRFSVLAEYIRSEQALMASRRISPTTPSRW